jgi:hypothetical protein
LRAKAGLITTNPQGGLAMTTDTQHLEGIRLQAERVVRAYNELRADAASADFKSGDFPVGKFAALVEQVKRLEGWLQPPSGGGPDLRHAAERVVREYRNQNGELAVTDTAEGKLVTTRHDLALALDQLETALDVETGKESVTDSTLADDDEPTKYLCDRLTSDETALIYSIQAIARALYKRDDGDVGLAMALKRLADDFAGRL